jgi:hypothetical protein
VGSETSAERFFVLEEGVLGSRYDADVETVEPINREEGVRCPRCGVGIGMRTWLPPYRCDLILHGEELGDFLQGSGDDLLVSERFAQAFREEGLTGLEGFHPVDVRRVRGRRRGARSSAAPRYLFVKACFGHGALDFKRSHLRFSEPPSCAECLSVHLDTLQGFSLEPGTWRHEDIFRPRGLHGWLLVSERFARFVERWGFTHLRLTPSEEYLWDPAAPPPLPESKLGAG